MKERIIQEVQQQMLPYLNNEQIQRLGDVLEHSLCGLTICESTDAEQSKPCDVVNLFLTAKRTEGCSEKTLSYYQKTIMAMLTTIGRPPQQILTDDLRQYLTDYQQNHNSSKVTIDNIRRILSSFFSWLEDEDYIVKSPIRRIHKVKTAKVIKDTYSDEELELRDGPKTKTLKSL